MAATSAKELLNARSQVANAIAALRNGKNAATYKGRSYTIRAVKGGIRTWRTK